MRKPIGARSRRCSGAATAWSRPNGWRRPSSERAALGKVMPKAALSSGGAERLFRGDDLALLLCDRRADRRSLEAPPLDAEPQHDQQHDQPDRIIDQDVVGRLDAAIAERDDADNGNDGERLRQSAEPE